MPRIDAIPYVVFDANGDPVSGGSVNFFTAGTTTPVTVYSDAALSASLGASVATNAAGQLVSGGSQVDVYGPAGSYKVVVRNAANVELATFDNIVVRSSPLSVPEGGTGVESVTALRDLLDITSQSAVGPFRNKIINGQFNINARAAASYTATGYTLDRWHLSNGAGAANTITQTAATLGVGTHAHVLSWARGTAGSGNSTLFQSIEDVRTLQGQTATLTFYASASAPTEMATRVVQNFGTGGSPSAEVFTGTGGPHNITATRQKFCVAFSVPSVTGKVLGTDLNSFLRLVFARPFDSTNPTTTVFIDNVSLVPGNATLEDDPGAWRDETTERLLAERYFAVLRALGNGGGHFYSAASVVRLASAHFAFRVPMRALPTVSVKDAFSHANSTFESFAVSPEGVVIRVDKDGDAGTYRSFDGSINADAEL